MEIAPILILGFKRPENIIEIIEAIRPESPRKVYFAVDGPRANKPLDFLEVAKTQLAIQSIDWDCEVRTRFREENLGLRRAIPDAVSWVLENEKCLIVVEDDAIPGPEVLKFMTSQLNDFEDDNSVVHVSGYNLVPVPDLTNPDSKIRMSRYPESYLWGTWSTAWKLYRDDLTGYQDLVKHSDLNYKEKLIWRLNFKMAELDLIHTWAYRWIFSMWANQGFCISPNRNLTKYVGQVDGTHTKRKTKVTELPITYLPSVARKEFKKQYDIRADSFISQEIFKATGMGVLYQTLVFIALFLQSRIGKKSNRGQ